MDWTKDDNIILHQYRYAHQLDVPPAFLKNNNQRILSQPGIAQHSPTMARRKECRRASKELLAGAVRKEYNAAMIHEQDVIASFIYAVENQGMIW